MAAATASLACALLAWLALRIPGGEPARPAVVRAQAPAALEARPSSPLRRDADAPGREQPEPAIIGEAAPPAKPALAAGSPPAVDLLVRFVDPANQPLTVTLAHVLCLQEGAPPRLDAVADASEALVRALAPLATELRVEALGFRHEPQALDLAQAAPDGAGPVVERAWLWPPERWVAVRVETPEGAPFEVLAEAVGLTPRQLFYGAFEARAAWAPPPEGAPPAAEPDAPRVRWRRPPVYTTHALPGACVGSLEVLEEPRTPMWVGLWMHGLPLGWRHLEPGAHELRFQLDAQALTERFAELRLRVVDEAGAPLPGARLTLKADAAPHRREDLKHRAPDMEGRFELARLVPGRYELALVHGEVAHQERLELAPGEARDLGEVALRAGAAVAVRVLDADGAATPSWIEVAPYERGAFVEDQYPPNLWRHEHGDHRLPLPTGRSIVRARGWDPHVPHDPGTISASVLLDPEHPPAAPLVLVVHEPRELRFEVHLGAAARLEVRDALDLVVARAALGEGSQARVRLVPGGYRVRLLASDGALASETPLSVPLIAAGDPRPVVLR